MNERDGFAEPTLDRPTAEEEEVRRLLMEAGPRDEVPTWDLATIKAAARREWGDVVAAERERKRVLRGSGALALAASLVLAVLLAWWWSARTPPAAPELVASVELVRGAARIDGVAGRAAGGAVAGERLPAGAELLTGEAPAGSLALRLGGGQSLRLDGGTRVRLLTHDRVELASGAVYLDSGPAAAVGAPVAIVTEYGVVRDIGTQFEVRLDAGEAAVRVRVREGKVTLDSDGATHLAAAGEELQLGHDGSLTRGSVSVYGAPWEWVQRSAPSLEIEGLPLPAFLAWVSRETGLAVEWESPALERSAASIRLHGTIAELTPEESLGLLLPASGLGYEIEPGVLRVAGAAP